MGLDLPAFVGREPVAIASSAMVEYGTLEDDLLHLAAAKRAIVSRLCVGATQDSVLFVTQQAVSAAGSSCRATRIRSVADRCSPLVPTLRMLTGLTVSVPRDLPEGAVERHAQDGRGEAVDDYAKHDRHWPVTSS